MGYIDSTSRFLHCSAIGHKYLLVGYNYDTNAILFEPLRNRQEKTIINKFENINQQFATVKVQTHTYVLDKEVSNTLNK